jgi:hypothetical protein
MWHWGDRIRESAADNMSGVRKRAADALRQLADATESGPKRTKTPIRSVNAETSTINPDTLVTLSSAAQRRRRGSRSVTTIIFRSRVFPCGTSRSGRGLDDHPHATVTRFHARPTMRAFDHRT